LADIRIVSNQRDTLHKRAERLLRRNPERISGISEKSLPELVHDLAVHQIALELQRKDLQQARLGIEELRAEYTSLYDNAPVGYLMFDKEGVISNANLTTERLLGVERKFLLNNPFSSFVHTDSQDAFSLHCRRIVYSEGRRTCKLVLKRGDGTYFDARIDSIAIRLRRRIVVFSALIDITKRKMTEVRLRESEERYRVAIENSNDGIALVRGDRHIYVNRKFLEIFGYHSLEEVVGKTHYLTVHPDDRQKVVEYNRRRQRDEAVPDRYEFKGVRKDGTPIYIDASVAAITYQGEPASLAYLRDITKRKHAERALQESEEKFRLLFEKSADPILLLDGDTYVDCNEAALRLMGCSNKDRLIGLHPWDISPTRQPDGRLSSEKVKELTDMTMRQGINQFEWMRRTFDGEEFWVEVSHTVIPIRGRQIVYNVWRDIRERKQAEAQLRESEERYRVAIESSNDGVVLIKGKVLLYVNRRLLDILGYDSVAEVVGRNVGLAVHPDDYERVIGYARMRERGEQAPSRYEFRAIRRDGAIIFVEASVSRITYQGEPASLGYLRDVTERRRAEKQRELVTMILQILNGPDDSPSVIRRILFLLKEHTAVDAIGLRLRRGGDFPYAEAIGFPEHFLEAEKFLCSRNESGGIVINDLGGPHLECLCGRIIRGRADPSLPFFTKAGSFWTNSMTGLPASLKEDPRERIRPCCMSEGYESMALIPLRSREEIIGLLQLNDRRPDRSTPGTIEFLESVAASIGMALARKEAEERIHASERKYRSIFENAIEGIFQSTPEGRLISVNPALARIHRYDSPEEMMRDVDHIGKKLWVSREDRVRYRNLVQKDGVVRAFQAEQYRKDGTAYWASITTHAARDTKGKLLYYEGMIQDITERRRLEGQLQQTQKMEAIGTLSAGIAHDFNNILTAILGFADLGFEDAPADSKAKRHLARVLRAAQRGKDLVTQILSFSRKGQEELRPTLLAPVVKESTKMLRASLPKTIEIRGDVTTEPLLALADPTQIQQIIMNLGINAAHAMRQKGGLMTVDLSCVTVTPDDAPDARLTPGPCLKLSVGDTGTGMDRDTLERVFDPFFTTKKRGEGTGLGLWVVQTIVKNHNGAITVRSAPGKGSTFEVFLPRIPEQVLPASEPPLSALKGHGRLLIVDDETDLVELEKEMVERLGYSATTVIESAAALALFKENPDKYDLVLTDQTMPGMTGIDLARELLSVRPDIPIVLVTGYRDVLDAELAREAGVKVIIAKPMTRAEIGLTIKQLLTRDGR
jgi:PAS domain S-box-containing protein